MEEKKEEGEEEEKKEEDGGLRTYEAILGSSAEAKAVARDMNGLLLKGMEGRWILKKKSG